MSKFDPIVMLDHDGNTYRVTMDYTEGVINEIARRVGRELDEKVLDRLGFVKVVRCRDCKRVTIDQGDHDYREPLWCGLFHVDVSLDGYCAWGERRDA